MISVSNDELVVRLRTIAGLMESGEYVDFAAYIEEAADRLERNPCKSSTESSKGSGSSSS